MAEEFKACSIDKCNGNAHRIAAGRDGLCNSHYGRRRRHGDPSKGNPSRTEALPFLHSSVIPYEGDGCLTWPFSKSHYGYGIISIKGVTHVVSRLVCQAVHGSPPNEKYEAAHSCGKGHLSCVNPKHLSWKTRSENQRDRVEHGTSNRGERQWKAKLTEEDAVKIRLLGKAKTGKEISLQFKVSEATISRVLSGKRWGWLK